MMFESTKGNANKFSSVKNIRITFEPIDGDMTLLMYGYHHFKWATPYSAFKQVREYHTAKNRDGAALAVTTSVTYYIDNYKVSEQTFCDTINKMVTCISNITNKTPIASVTHISDGVTIWTYKNNVETIKDTRADHVIFDESQQIAKSEEFKRMLKDCCKSSYTEEEIEDAIRGMLINYHNHFKGDKNMKNLTITNYNYNSDTGVTTLYWSDKTQTSVTADPDTEPNEFVGFCAACAKKLFGNKSTYLNQFDKWTVKIPARQKAEAEKKAAEEKELAERKAKRAAKKAEKKKQRMIEQLAQSIADDYYGNEVINEVINAAEKLAIDKYKVPAEYFEELNECDCGCHKDGEQE